MKSLNVISGSGEMFQITIPENGVVERLSRGMELISSGSSESGFSVITAALEDFFPRNYRTALRKITVADAFKLASAFAQKVSLRISPEFPEDFSAPEKGSFTGVIFDTVPMENRILQRSVEVDRERLAGVITAGTAPQEEHSRYTYRSLKLPSPAVFSVGSGQTAAEHEPDVYDVPEMEFYPVSDEGFVQPGLPFARKELPADNGGLSENISAAGLPGTVISVINVSPEHAVGAAEFARNISPVSPDGEKKLFRTAEKDMMQINDDIIAVALAFKWTLEYAASLPQELLHRCMKHAGLTVIKSVRPMPVPDFSPEDIRGAAERGLKALENFQEHNRKKS
ncbi:MAG: hypothetical protein IKA87_02770 [Lentisphaeria bacterium]|nr:hypothetical protein [Lentisphaeria bacterium]